MRLPILLTTLTLLAASMPAEAGNSGEEALALDLGAAGGPTIFVKCSRWEPGKARDFANCGLVSLWQQSNPIPGLQTTIYSYAGKPWDPDHKLLA